MMSIRLERKSLAEFFDFLWSGGGSVKEDVKGEEYSCLPLQHNSMGPE